MTSMLRRAVNRLAQSGIVVVVIGLISIIPGASIDRAEPARAASGDGITAYVSPPLVQGPPNSYGASLETFASWTSCNSFPASAVGTFSGSCQRLTNGNNYVWGGASSTSDTPFVGGVPSEFVVAHGTNLTLTFASPAKYVGFWWSAGSANNVVNLYTAASGATPAATFTTATIDSILGASIPSPYPGTATVSAIDGTTYKKGHYFGRPSNHASLTPSSFSGQNNQSHAYLNIFASGSIEFTKIEFTGMNFEFDNVAISTSTQSPTQNLVFIESVLGKTVNFLPNGGSGTMNAQTESAATTLSANTFNRPGYTFTGWHTTASGTGGTSFANQASYSFSSDLTLHAQWTLTPTTTMAPVVTTSTTTPATTTTTTTTTAPLAITSITTPVTQPTLEAPRIAVAGQPISVMAQGFTPGEKVVLRVGDGKTVTLVANSLGVVQLEMVLDSTMSGKKDVVASAVVGGRSVRSEIRVTALQTLPSTGSSSVPLIALGLCIALLGCALQMLKRFLRTA